MLGVFDSAGPMTRLARTPRIVLPSLTRNEVGTPERVITELNTRPAWFPCQRLRRALAGAPP